MRTRLNRIHVGETFRFLCDQAMARKIELIIRKAGGKIVEQDNRSYGVVFQVQRK